jgi:hypothetical protein
MLRVVVESASINPPLSTTPKAFVTVYFRGENPVPKGYLFGIKRSIPLHE